MDDSELTRRIAELVDEEHRLENAPHSPHDPEVAQRVRGRLNVVAKGRAALKGRMGRVEVHALRGGPAAGKDDPFTEEAVEEASLAVG